MNGAVTADTWALGVLKGAMQSMLGASYGVQAKRAMCHAVAAMLLLAVMAMPAAYCMHEGDAWKTPKGWHKGVFSVNFCLLCRRIRRRLLKAVLTWTLSHQATLRSPLGQPRP